MEFNAPINTNTASGARQALEQMAQAYTQSGHSGRVAFSRDEQGHLAGTDRSRGLWANLRSISTSKYTDAKAEFATLIRTAYPEHADAILDHIATRQEDKGVENMLTPGMIKEAYQKATELYGGWMPDVQAADIIAHPQGADPTRRDLAAAIGLIKDGAKPALEQGFDAADRGQIKMLQQNQMKDTSQFAACHDTAAQLQNLMGEPASAQHAGGAGPANRALAVQLAIDSINHGPCIIQIKATATADGHSFSLVCKPNGKVDVLEAWASGHAEMDLGALLGQCKKDLPKDQVIAALQKIIDPDPDVRTEGYTSLSTAYPDSALFELHHDPDEEETLDECRDDDARITLEVFVRDLKPAAEVAQKLTERLELVEEWKGDIALTPTERQALQNVGIATAEAW